jgi:ribosomal protein S18 acetylase RimI-like enzyme
MKDVLYRRYQEGDKKYVWDLHVQALKDTGAFLEDGPKGFDDDLLHIKKVYLEGNGEFIVAVIEGNIVGMGALKKVNTQRAEIKRMRVKKEHRGKGIGKNMFQILEKQARTLSYKKLVLDTTTKQEVAQSFYEKYGFLEIKRERLRDDMDIIFYEKDIGIYT